MKNNFPSHVHDNDVTVVVVVAMMMMNCTYSQLVAIAPKIHTIFSSDTRELNILCSHYKQTSVDDTAMRKLWCDAMNNEIERNTCLLIFTWCNAAYFYGGRVISPHKDLLITLTTRRCCCCWWHCRCVKRESQSSLIYLIFQPWVDDGAGFLFLRNKATNSSH